MHLIVLPHYCKVEVDNFCKTAELWAKLTKTDLEYEFLAVFPYNGRINRQLEKTFSELGKVRHLKSHYKGRGLRKPERGYKMTGGTAMFWSAFEHIGEHYKDDDGFVLWLEHDMVPLVPDWLDQLDEAWQRTNKKILGQFIRKPFNNTRPHMNGGACYSKSLDKIIKTKDNYRLPFDVGLSKVAKGKMQHTKLFELWIQEETMGDRVPKPETVILHGVLDDSAREYAYKINNI